MSYRYRCSSARCTYSVDGSDKYILKLLPLELQSEFPAYLTHRSGVSKRLGDLLRSLVQNSVGPQRVAKILQELHTLKHDRMELQYLSSALSRQCKRQRERQLTLTRDVVKPFSPFADKQRYGGHTPSPGHLRLVYTTMVDEMRPLIDKQLSLLDGKILKGDHSFKLVKHLAKIGGASTFSALYTLCNEYEEIRMQVFAPTKSLSHLRASFQSLLDSYRLYGHSPPEYFFTDNVTGDKRFLEDVLPTLSDINSQRSSAPTTFLPLRLPQDVTVRCMGEAAAINGASNVLMESLSDWDSGSRLYVGFDCEWNVDRTGTGQEKLQVIQLAFDSTVYIFRVGRLTSLPTSLVALLKSPQVIKLGRQVGTDFAKIHRSFVIECKGSLELGTFCKDRGIINNSFMGLSDICSEVLSQRLSKDPNIPFSNWAVRDLSQEQVEYAALDV
jgi:hypothetical protein